MHYGYTITACALLEQTSHQGAIQLSVFAGHRSIALVDPFPVSVFEKATDVTCGTKLIAKI